MWDLIVSIPDHCLSFYFPLIPLEWTVEMFSVLVRIRIRIVYW